MQATEITERSEERDGMRMTASCCGPTSYGVSVESVGASEGDELQAPKITEGIQEVGPLSLPGEGRAVDRYLYGGVATYLHSLTGFLFRTSGGRGVDVGD